MGMLNLSNGLQLLDIFSFPVFMIFFSLNFSLQSFYYLIFKFTDYFLSYVQAPDEHMEGIFVTVYF